MFEHLHSDRSTRGASLRSGAILAAGMIGGAALLVLLGYLTFEKHPFGWSAVPREVRALGPHASWIEYDRAFAAARRREVWEALVRTLLVDLLPIAIVLRRAGSAAPARAAALGTVILGALLALTTRSVVPAAVCACVAAYLLTAIKVADQWEKCVVLRFGRFHALRGPGMFRIVPIVERVGAVVDGRVRTTAVHAEAALTRDTVPVHVDAVIFWAVWDVGKAVLEVADFDRAVALVGQTALLESIGRHDLARMIAERAALGRDLQAILEQKTIPWGITVQSVEIRDVRLPATLQDALSRQAQAERERQARIIYGATEVELAAKFDEASAAYRDDPVALHLRAMNMLYEAIKEKGSMIVVPPGAFKDVRRRHRSSSPRADRA